MTARRSDATYCRANPGRDQIAGCAEMLASEVQEPLGGHPWFPPILDAEAELHEQIDERERPTILIPHYSRREQLYSSMEYALMASRMATRLQEFFEAESDGHLRSIIAYKNKEYDIVYLRDDVAEEYSEDEIAAARGNR